MSCPDFCCLACVFLCADNLAYPIRSWPRFAPLQFLNLAGNKFSGPAVGKFVLASLPAQGPAAEVEQPP